MIKFIDYGINSLDDEINNYLYCLNDVCQDKKGVRRYVTSILRLYEKLNSLSVSDDSIELKRTLRKSSRYINKIKKFAKKIKNVDLSVFKLASDMLFNKNNSINSVDSDEAYFNRYCKEDWDSEKISRTLIGDISKIIDRKKSIISDSTKSTLNSSETVYFDEIGNNVSENVDNTIDNNSALEEVKDDEIKKVVNDIYSIDVSNKMNIEEKEKLVEENDNLDNSDYIERTLIKKELQELKKEIDHNEDLFINVDHVVPEQKCVIKSYISVCSKYNVIEKMFHYLYDDSTNSDIVGIYEKIYDFVGFLISEMFEHIIHLSKLSCDINEQTGLFEEKYVMDRSVIDVFGRYDIFIAKVQNFVKLLNEKKSDNLSSFDKENLSKVLWNKYRLDDISPSSIKEAVSLDLLTFVNENPFTLIQTVSLDKKVHDSYKKYDLDIILENVEYKMEKHIPELFNSIKNKVLNDSLLNESDKKYAISNVIKSFSKFIANIHGISEYPIAAHDYLIGYIMNKVFSCDIDIDSMFNDCVQKIYSEESEKYKSLGFFEKILYSKEKINISLIEKKVNDFTQKIDNISFDTK